MISNDDIRICAQNVRNVYVKMYVMDKNDNILDEISGKAIEGTIDMDGTANIQRQVNNLKILLDSNTLLPNQKDSLIWTDKHFQLKIGIADLLKPKDDPDYIHWYNMGIFLYKTVEMDYSSTESYLMVNGLDKMCKFTGDLGGQFETDIKIENSGVPITEAIRHIAVDLGGEDPNKLLLDNVIDDDGNILSLPYTMTKAVGDTMYDAMKELADLYKYYIFYYDENGYLVLEHLKLLLDSPVDVDFRDVDYTISNQVQEDYTYIKNYVKVVGQALSPTVTTIDSPTVDNPNPVNNSSSVKLLFNKPVYDSNHNRIVDGADLKTYFAYDGTASNYTKAVYNDNDWSIMFTITGENGKILKPNSNMIYDSGEMPFDDGGIIFSDKEDTWSKLLSAIVVTDGVNNTTQFILSFNKALFDKDGIQLNNNTDVKNSFTYSNGNAGNFLSATYTYDSYSWQIKLNFAQAIQDAVIEINKDGLNNEHSLYDSSGTIYQPESYIMTGETWTKVIDTPLPSYQVSAYAENTDNTSPYSIDNIGKRVLSINEDKIYNVTQGQMRADFELQTHSNLNESVTLSCLQQYYMKPNTILYLYNKKYGIDGKYVVNKISYSLKSSDNMSITCNKLYM
jgi:hypothetical protein